MALGRSDGRAETERMKLSQMELVAAILKNIDRQGVKELNPRQMNAVIDAANSIVDEFEKLSVLASPSMGLKAWLASDETGLSSKYLAHVLAPNKAPYAPLNIPHDPADFGRCVRLLDAAPELRAELPRLLEPQHGKPWNAIAAEWSILEAWYREDVPTKESRRLYERLGAIGALV